MKILQQDAKINFIRNIALTFLAIYRFHNSSALVICKLESTVNELFYLYKFNSNNKTWSVIWKSNLTYCVTKIITNDIDHHRFFKWLEPNIFKNI